MAWDFRTFRSARRLPAEPHKPVVDPAGWDPDEVRDVERWSYHFTSEDCRELRAAVAHARRNGVDIADVSPQTFPLEGLAATLEDVRREIADGRGMVRLRDLDRKSTRLNSSH